MFNTQKTALFIIFLGISSFSFAQKLDNQFLLSHSFSAVRNQFYYPVYSSYIAPAYYNRDRESSFTFIQSYRKTRAWRLGLGVKFAQDNNYSLQTFLPYPDSNGYYYLNFQSTAPYLFLGHENRKYLHPDVFIVTGADLGLGASFLQERLYNIYKYGYRPSYNEIGFYGRINPFIGARVNWGSFILGYSFAAPAELYAYNTHINMDINLYHKISLGLKFNQRRHIKKRSFLFSR